MAAPAATADFLAGRLAKASAIPAEQRSADVRAFIETCRLQEELLEELRLPKFVSLDTDVLSRWSAVPALKLVRSHFISPSGPIPHSPELRGFASYSIYMRTSFGCTGILPSDLGHELTELLEADPSLETFAILAAGLPGVRDEQQDWRAGECQDSS